MIKRVWGSRGDGVTGVDLLSTGVSVGGGDQGGSAAEAIESAALPLQRVDYIECSHGLPLGVLSVGDGVADDVLQEGAEHVAGLLIDETGDALDAATASQSPDSGLSDAEDSLLEGLLGVSLGADLAVAFANFASASHVCVVVSL